MITIEELTGSIEKLLGVGFDTKNRLPELFRVTTSW